MEIDRALYMDEINIRPNRNFERFRESLRGIIAAIAEIGRPAEERLAAE